MKKEEATLWAWNLEFEDWVRFFSDLGEPGYRAEQVCRWLYSRNVFDVREMTDLSKALRETLSERLSLKLPERMAVREAKKDGTRKFLWRLEDGQTIESVLLRHAGHLTACLSTQVGCPLGCVFCATGQSGYARNLQAGEIVGQFVAMEADLGERISHLVLMGMGEPLLNFEAVIKSLRILAHPKMRDLSIRHMAISTAGIVPQIDALAGLGFHGRLALSLHAPTDALRSRLMPINQRYPLRELMAALKRYQRKTGDRITIEYMLLDKVNDAPKQAHELVRLLSGLSVFVNLIPANPVQGPYRRSKPQAMEQFRSLLVASGIEAEVRTEKGTDIDAACGQLRRRFMTATTEKGVRPS